jgi:putative addiction module component (TIGR02574 family)
METDTDSRQVLEEALRLKPVDRFLLVEGLLKSLDEPDQDIGAIWAEEAEKRLRAYRTGRLQGIPEEDVFR